MISTDNSSVHSGRKFGLFVDSSGPAVGLWYAHDFDVTGEDSALGFDVRAQCDEVCEAARAVRSGWLYPQFNDARIVDFNTA